MKRFETLPEHVLQVAKLIHDRVDKLRAESIDAIDVELDLLDSDAQLLEDLALGALKDLKQSVSSKPER